MNDIIYVGRHALTLRVSNHAHESWELIYCTSGKGEICFKDRTFTYFKDTIVIIPPMIPHSNWSDSGFTNIHVNIVDSTLNFKEPVILSCTSNVFLRQAFEAAFYYYSNNGIGRTTLLPVYGQLIAATTHMLASDIAHSEVVQQIINDILKNYPDADYDLNAYLQSLPFSFEYLKKMFKNEVGMTPRQYLTDKRLENAANNLALSGCGSSISQIARQSGFQEPLYFSRLFKKKYGVSPKNYTPDNLEPPTTDSDSTKIILQAAADRGERSHQCVRRQ